MVDRRLNNYIGIFLTTPLQIDVLLVCECMGYFVGHITTKKDLTIMSK